jgi:hypothetical protein
MRLIFVKALVQRNMGDSVYEYLNRKTFFLKKKKRKKERGKRKASFYHYAAKNMLSVNLIMLFNIVKPTASWRYKIAGTTILCLKLLLHNVLSF